MRLIISGALIGASLEIFTLILRFYFGFEATRDTSFIASLSGGIRIHHGYIGVLLIIVTFIPIRQAGSLSKPEFSARHWLFALGLGLVLSDLAHHFLVLQLITGDPQFDLFYPAR